MMHCTNRTLLGHLVYDALHKPYASPHSKCNVKTTHMTLNELLARCASRDKQVL